MPHRQVQSKNTNLPLLQHFPKMPPKKTEDGSVEGVDGISAIEKALELGIRGCPWMTRGAGLVRLQLPCLGL